MIVRGVMALLPWSLSREMKGQVRGVACLIEILFLLAAEGDAAANDLLRKFSAHDELHGRLLLGVPHVLVHQILHSQFIPCKPESKPENPPCIPRSCPW